MFSIPKNANPSLDRTGQFCLNNQIQKNVWFLAGTFGNITVIKRKCTIPYGKAIFLPILVKEDSFAEDSDLRTYEDLKQRCRTATDNLVSIEAVLDEQVLGNLTEYRAHSEIFRLTFPEENVYEVTPGPTYAACDGFWLFIKPPHVGNHLLCFRGETLLENPFTLNQLLGKKIHSSIHKHIQENLTFRIQVLYELTITDHKRK
jgi:hypothetical protein